MTQGRADEKIKEQAESTVVQISRVTHVRIKVYCDKYGFKISRWLDRLVNDYLDGNFTRAKTEDHDAEVPGT